MKTVELPPFFVDDRVVFKVKMKANIADFWQCAKKQVHKIFS